VIGRTNQIVTAGSKGPVHVFAATTAVFAAMSLVETVAVPLFATTAPRPIPLAPWLMLPLLDPPEAPVPLLPETVQEIVQAVAPADD
jgi:hypothetical protein